MADGYESPAGPSTIAKLAMGLALVSIVVVVIAVAVVASRSPRTTSVAAERPVAAAPGPDSVVVDARDVVRMDRGTVEPVTDPRGVVGIRINDPELLATLHLESTDVITAISGKTVRRQFDVNDALAGASLANATALYVELVRAGQPRLVKWELEGDLREARAGGRPRIPPVATAMVADPLSDTIKRVTDFDFELPRMTLVQIATSVQSGVVRSLRLVPSFRNGVASGVKVFSIRSGSVWAALGFKNGDTLVSVNGRPLSATTLGDEFERVKNEATIELSIVRMGQPTTLKYSITK